jgi:hypothetical protein
MNNKFRSEDIFYVKTFDKSWLISGANYEEFSIDVKLCQKFNISLFCLGTKAFKCIKAFPDNTLCGYRNKHRSNKYMSNWPAKGDFLP